MPSHSIQQEDVKGENTHEDSPQESDQSVRNISKTPKKTKGIKKIPKEGKISQQDGEELSEGIRQKNKNKTKNLLVTFRKLIVDYLMESDINHQGRNFLEFQKGNSTNLRAYETIFRDPELKPTLAKMFLERYLQRALQLSRTNIEQKTIYL